MAEIVDSLCKGQSDGRERTILESLLTLEATEIQSGDAGGSKDVFAAIRAGSARTRRSIPWKPRRL